MNKSIYHLHTYHSDNEVQDINNIIQMFIDDSKDIVEKILNESMNIPDYYPNDDEPIPLDQYSEEFSKVIREKQEQFLAEYYDRKEYNHILVQTYHNRLLFHYKNQVELYDCIILLRGDRRIIFSKYNKAVFKYLNSIEPENWFLDINPVYQIETIRNKNKSLIDFKDLNQINQIKEVCHE